MVYYLVCSDVSIMVAEGLVLLFTAISQAPKTVTDRCPTFNQFSVSKRIFSRGRTQETKAGECPGEGAVLQQGIGSGLHRPRRPSVFGAAASLRPGFHSLSLLLATEKYPNGSAAFLLRTTFPRGLRGPRLVAHPNEKRSLLLLRISGLRSLV